MNGGQTRSTLPRFARQTPYAWVQAGSCCVSFCKSGKPGLHQGSQLPRQLVLRVLVVRWPDGCTRVTVPYDDNWIADTCKISLSLHQLHHVVISQMNMRISNWLGKRWISMTFSAVLCNADAAPALLWSKCRPLATCCVAQGGLGRLCISPIDDIVTSHAPTARPFVYGMGRQYRCWQDFGICWACSCGTQRQGRRHLGL